MGEVQGVQIFALPQGGHIGQVRASFDVQGAQRFAFRQEGHIGQVRASFDVQGVQRSGATLQVNQSGARDELQDVHVRARRHES